MVEFRRNEETGILEVWENGKKVGEIVTMGDEIIGDNGRIEPKANDHG